MAQPDISQWSDERIAIAFSLSHDEAKWLRLEEDRLEQNLAAVRQRREVIGARIQQLDVERFRRQEAIPPDQKPPVESLWGDWLADYFKGQTGEGASRGAG